MDEYQKILQEAKSYLGYKNILEDKDLPNPLYLIMNLARLLRQHLEPAWNPVTQKPEKSGNYLVSLREDNSLEFNHKEPIIAQFDYYRRHPQSWTANDAFGDIQVIDQDVLWWMELPEVPKNPPFDVWINWEYTEENPYPKLEGDPLVHVRFADSSESKDKPCGAQPISYWHGDGTNDGNSLNNFYQGYSEDELLYETQIIAYMLVDPNNHD